MTYYIKYSIIGHKKVINMVISRKMQKIYQVIENRRAGDDYDASSVKTILGTYPIKSLADKEVERLDAEKSRYENTYHTQLDVSYWVKDKKIFVDPKEAWQHKPDYFVHIDEVDPIKDTCGEIRELLYTEHMSHAYVTLLGVAKEHKHNVMEEVYTIIKGHGHITISGTKYEIDKGETISIPKNEWHYLESDSGLELLVVTSPRFDPKDVILR